MTPDGQKFGDNDNPSSFHTHRLHGVDDLRVEPHPAEVDKPLGPNDVRVRVREMEGREGQREGRDGEKGEGKMRGERKLQRGGSYPAGTS